MYLYYVLYIFVCIYWLYLNSTNNKICPFPSIFLQGVFLLGRIWVNPIYLTIVWLPISGNMPRGARVRAPLGCNTLRGSGCVPSCPLQWRAGTAYGGIFKLIAGNSAVVINPEGLGLLKVTVNGPQAIRNLCIWNKNKNGKENSVHEEEIKRRNKSILVGTSSKTHIYSNNSGQNINF